MSRFHRKRSIQVYNHYEVYLSNYNQAICVAAQNIYDACSKVHRLISTWETSESHEIVQVSLAIGTILC